MMTRGAEVNLKNDGGRTALHYAASKGWVKVAELLLARGVNINAKDKMHACIVQQAQVTQSCVNFIEEGAEIDALDKADETLLMNAVICEHRQVNIRYI
ncbi:Protein TANC1 [Bienertia sinuspersici]